MEDLLETLCGKMTLTEGEKVGITISEDETADIRMKSERSSFEGSCLIDEYKKKHSRL
jgi:predicted DNA-binding antitoxin AbrB/MazE fold protein